MEFALYNAIPGIPTRMMLIRKILTLISKILMVRIFLISIIVIN